MDSIDQLKTFKKELDRELIIFLDAKIKEAVKISPTAQELLQHITDLTMRGGKRIRPALMYYSYLANGGNLSLNSRRYYG